MILKSLKSWTRWLHFGDPDPEEQCEVAINLRMSKQEFKKLQTKSIPELLTK